LDCAAGGAAGTPYRRSKVDRGGDVVTAVPSPVTVRGTPELRAAEATPADPRGTARGRTGAAACSTNGVFTGSMRGDTA
jgi:hypothetical protein